MEFDLHIHSKYSFDSMIEPQKIVEKAKKIGLDGIAITDHNSTRGGIEAMKYAGDDFIVIPGIEIGTKFGDIVGLFVKEDIRTQDPYEALDLIKQQDGIACLAHPTRKSLKLEERFFNKLHAIEGFNARHGSVKNIKEFAKRHRLAILGGSDAHFYREIGRGKTIIQDGGLTKQTLSETKEAILSCKTLSQGRKTSSVFRIFTGIIGLPHTLTRKIKKVLKFN